MMQSENIGSLIHRVALALDQTSDQVLKERLGISLSQFRILIVLLENDGQKQKSIAHQLNQTEASISRQIKLLSERQLVVVRRSLSSRRDRLIFLTARGSKTGARAMTILNEYHRPMFDRLNQKQQTELLETLKTIRKHLG